ncbi:MAG: cold-shock protein [Oceanospirillaceae bacterium]|nr:cold-shock protein [Oceanospirillaceae bacterium]
MVRKLIVSLVAAVIVPLVFSLAFNGLFGGLALADGSTLADQNLTGILVILALLGFGISMTSAMLAEGGGVSDGRISGTAFEADVDDGRERGVVKWFNVKKGFGFITWDAGEDVFVHFRSIRGQGHRSLTEGQRVKFTVVQGEKGPQAEDVTAIR